MSKSKKGNPYRSGLVVVSPPGMAMPPETGFTPFWEKEKGLLYVSNKEAQKVNLSIGQSIRFKISSSIMPSKRRVMLAHSISNV